jgi:hypothetical protein
MSQPANKPDATLWHAEVLRVTGFPSPSASIKSQNWWSEVAKGLPDSRQEQPKRGVVREEGDFEDVRLILETQPTRIDWYLVKPPDAEVPTFDFTTASRFDDAIRRWLHVAPPLIRLAFGAVLIFPVISREEGYLKLSKFLPGIKLDPEGSSDFSYQINRPRKISLGENLDIKINRLSKWSVAMKEIRHFTPSLEQFVAASREHLCRLELDISTPQDFKGNLPQLDLDQILVTLIELGREIAREGDIP